MEEGKQIKKVLVPVSDGFEEIETVSIIDILRRADLDVTFATIKGKDKQNLTVHGSRGIDLITDTYFEDCIDIDYDMIAVPGGIQNAETLGNFTPLIEKLKQQKKQNKYYAAICASPYFVFEKNGLLKGEVGTANPGFDKLEDRSKIEERVVVSNKCITSRSAGTATEFAIQLVEELCSPEKATNLAQVMLIRR